jgi:glycosyltransferase involved in cell wall biosynthesis
LVLKVLIKIPVNNVKKQMKIGVNVSFLRKGDSGIGQVTHNFLKKLCEVKSQKSKVKLEKVEFYLYAEEDFDLEVELPGNFHKRVFLPPYKRDDLIRKIWWEKYLLPKKAKEDGCEVFLSLYQSATVFEQKNKHMNRATSPLQQSKNPLGPPLKKGEGRKGGGIKHVMLVHDVVPKVFPEYLGNWRKKLYYGLVDKAVVKADEIVTISKYSKKEIVRFYDLPEKKVKVAYIDCDEVFKEKGVGAEDFPPGEIKEVLGKYGVEPDNKKYKEQNGSGRETLNQQFNYIFYVGGFDVRKNVDGLLEAYRMFYNRLEDKNKAPDLVLAGKFNEHLVPLVTDLPKKIDEIADKYGVPKDRFKNVGFVAGEDLPYFYAGASFFAYPSFYEGFGLPVLEAASIGCPIITSNTSSIPEVINEKGAILVNPGNTEELAEAMRNLYLNCNLNCNLVSEAKRQAEKFSWEKFTKQIMKGVLASPPCKGGDRGVVKKY